MKTIIHFTFCLAVFFIISCGKKDVIPNPEKVTLIYPEQNSACVTANILSTTQSSLTFAWSSSANTSFYELHLKNLLSGSTTIHNANTNQLLINLDINTPYSWFIVSKSNATSTTSQSEIWKFYNAGPTVLSYAPFPAEAVSPKNNAIITPTSNGTIVLSWKAEDVDADIASYTINFGSNVAPPVYKSKQDANVTSIEVPVNRNSAYYWRIDTFDVKGNMSRSEIYMFRTN